MGKSYRCYMTGLDLDRFPHTKRNSHRWQRRRLASETALLLELQRRALVNLPPHESQILYQLKALQCSQGEISELHKVRQSNISYHLERSQYRIRLHVKLSQICSETTIHRVLCRLNSLLVKDKKMPMSDEEILTFKAVLKSSAQSRVAEVLGVKIQKAKDPYRKISKLLQEYQHSIPEAQQVLDYIAVVSSNWNQLCPPKLQGRWRWRGIRKTLTGK
jgi:hypothetical protein